MTSAELGSIYSVMSDNSISCPSLERIFNEVTSFLQMVSDLLVVCTVMEVSDIAPGIIEIKFANVSPQKEIGQPVFSDAEE